jgi:hypothetical protein
LTGIDALVMALAPAFAAGFAIQQLLELLNAVYDVVEPLGEKNKTSETKAKEKAERDAKTSEEKAVDVEYKKSRKTLILGILSLAAGGFIVYNTPIRVLQPFNVTNLNPTWDIVITVFFISAGTEGLNSILKFLGYSKEKKDAEAEDKKKKALK